MFTCPACSRANPAEASFCMGCGGPLGATATAHEARKTVTALFCDLVGSTALGETHDPEVLRIVLDRYFAAMRAAVEHHGGRVEKFIGDAVAAVFGLPVAHEDDALRAVRAGAEMQERLAAVNADSPTPLAARIGITTGEVLVPGGGTPLIGDAMNTAARLQSTAEPGSVVIGEPTWRLVRDAVVAEPLAPLDLKGKAEPVAAYRVLRVASVSPMRARRLDAPMVGRGRESALLREAFARAVSDRACQLFTVLGVAGAGKSRLVEEFLGSLAPGDATVLRGRCLPYGEGITWYPVTEALRGVLGLPEFAGSDAIRDALTAALAGEEHANALVTSLLPVFAAGPGGSAEETAWAIRRFLESQARERPVVLVLDDIHWGEPAFLDMVDAVADWSRDASILLLCMARPDLLDLRPAWGGGKTNATAISLAPLSTAETETFLDALVGPTALPPTVRERIGRVAGGNPLFVEEMVAMLVDDGRLVRDSASGGWVAAGDLSDMAVPPTISALLSARLDRLSDDERGVIEAASIEGQEFHRGAVAALLPEAARSDLPVHLRSLVRKELVTPVRSDLPGDDAYRFRHLLIRDAAYDAIPKASRAQLHRAFADWLEEVAGDRIAEQEEIVGYHLERAYRYRDELGMPEDRELRIRAGRALGNAGSRALDAGDVRAALDLLRPAAELTRGDRAELQILDDLDAAYSDSTHVSLEVRWIWERLEEAARELDDPVFVMRARYLAFIGSDFRDPRASDIQTSEDLLDEALRTFRRHGETRFEASVLFWQSNLAWRRGHAARMVDRSLEALGLARAAGRRREAGGITGNVITGLAYGPTPLTEVLARSRELSVSFDGERWAEAQLLSDRAFVEAWLGRPDAARVDAAAARDRGRELGYVALAELAPTSLAGDIAWCVGDLDGAVERWREAIGQYQALGDPMNPALIGPQLAHVLLDLGRDWDAEAAVRVVEAAASPHDTFDAPAISIRSVLAARRGDLGDALRLSDEAADAVGSMDFLMLKGDVALDRAEVLLLAGRPADARASAEEALALYERKEFAIGIRRARAFLATLAG